MVDAGGYRVDARLRGAGPALVWISGIGEPGTSWDPVLEVLDRPATSLTYDRGGIGASQPVSEPERPRAYSHFVDELARVWDGVKLPQPAVVVGHSFGCLIARLFAYHHPRRVSGLVLVESARPHITLWPAIRRATMTVTAPTPPESTPSVAARRSAP
jgi:pimeloyl-ACP methyl ester carboxylesterase